MLSIEILEAFSSLMLRVEAIYYSFSGNHSEVLMVTAKLHCTRRQRHIISWKMKLAEVGHKGYEDSDFTQIGRSRPAPRQLYSMLPLKRQKTAFNIVKCLKKPLQAGMKIRKVYGRDIMKRRSEFPPSFMPARGGIPLYKPQARAQFEFVQLIVPP